MYACKQARAHTRNRFHGRAEARWLVAAVVVRTAKVDRRNATSRHLTSWPVSHLGEADGELLRCFGGGDGGSERRRRPTSNHDVTLNRLAIGLARVLGTRDGGTEAANERKEQRRRHCDKQMPGLRTNGRWMRLECGGGEPRSSEHVPTMDGIRPFKQILIIRNGPCDLVSWGPQGAGVVGCTESLTMTAQFALVLVTVTSVVQAAPATGAGGTIQKLGTAVSCCHGMGRLLIMWRAAVVHADSAIDGDHFTYTRSHCPRSARVATRDS
jgi:hypothetical protein